MTPRQFFLQLLLLSAATALSLHFVNQLPAFQAYAGLSWLSVLFFILLSIAMYYAGRRSALSENKHHFTNTIMGFTMGKMMLSILLILVYLKLAEPVTKLFILPFFGVYLIYTIFETYFMTRLGRMSN